MSKVWIIIGLFLCIAIGCISLWTDRNLDFWMSYWQGKEIDVPYWMSLCLTIVLNAIILAGNIIGEIIRLCIG